MNGIKKHIPKSLLSAYHFFLAVLGALLYRFPSRQIKVVGITGTNGKSSTAELTSAILEKAGYKTAITGTVHFKINRKEEVNFLRMTMPGRFFIQKFLRKAVSAGCDWAIIEMTSEGAEQFRHQFIDMDSLIFTNLAHEHIESHGSFGKYLKAKLKIAKRLELSKKINKTIIVNADDKQSKKFADIKDVSVHSYSLKNAEPFSLRRDGTTLTFRGKTIETKMLGKFNIYNCLAAATFALTLGVELETIKEALQDFYTIPGRLEEVKVSDVQKFSVFVDYAHTPDSLKAVYEIFNDATKIAVFGNAGGGRDSWKRPEMGRIADIHCEKIILTVQDPYDENPSSIIEQTVCGMTNKKPEIILDRRQAIRRSLVLAHNECSKTETNGKEIVVLITGKGSDPYIMGPRRERTPWSDTEVVREELKKMF
ncbi:MAG: UDP-N-acetylmuramyl-tripeptide synthetase [bacterium]|nr:UDP-N-acetylmuramyl-tripeptide synthetase [bacterium]